MTADHSQDRNPYFMDSAQEGARLEGKTDPEVARAQLQMTGLRAGMRTLDVGCGTGAVTRVMASIAGPDQAVGVDLSSARLDQARQLARETGTSVEFVEGSAYYLPFASAHFDYAWSRFLFEYLPDPQGALVEMVRVTRPGGTVVVGDLDGQIEQFYPLDPQVRADLMEGLQILGRTGFDPWVGRKLFNWFHSAGLNDISVHVTPYQVYAGGLPERDMANWQQKFSASMESLTRITGDTEKWSRLEPVMNLAHGN
jgi:ubiquinone/menaquinone biosynthesis C-methylase UbiE